MRAIHSTLTLGGLLRGGRRTRNIYISWSGLMLLLLYIILVLVVLLLVAKEIFYSDLGRGDLRQVKDWDLAWLHAELW